MILINFFLCKELIITKNGILIILKIKNETMGWIYIIYYHTWTRTIVRKLGWYFDQAFPWQVNVPMTNIMFPWLDYYCWFYAWYVFQNIAKLIISLPHWFGSFKDSSLFLSTSFVCRNLAVIQAANDSSASNFRQDLLLECFLNRNF